MKWIGLTGGIASGKSTAARILRDLGATVIDADALAKRAVEPGSPALVEIARAFGAEMIGADGRLNRQRMAAKVFSNPTALAKLEAIVHPRVRALCAQERAAAEASGSSIAFYDVPLLFEKGMSGFDSTIAVVCRPEIQRARLLARDAMSAADADARIAAQLPIEEKVSLADRVVRNDGTVEELRAKLVSLLAEV